MWYVDILVGRRKSADASVDDVCEVEKGFTLIELLVVIGVIGVLAAGLLTVLNPIAQIQKANDSRRKSDLAQLQRALEQYYNDNRNYPGNDGSYRIVDKSGNPVSWNGSWGLYMQTMPKDPTTYTYAYVGGGQSYKLYAHLERGINDSQACSGGSCPGAPNATACGGTCNYGVTSPNTSP